MTGKTTSGSSRAERRQLPPQRCSKCRKRIKDGGGKVVNGFLLCQRCNDNDH